MRKLTLAELLPPVSTKHQAPSEEKPETGFKSRRTHFEETTTNPLYEFKDKVEIPIQEKTLHMATKSSQPPLEGKSGHNGFSQGTLVSPTYVT